MLDSVCRQAVGSAVPLSSSPESKSGVVNLVVDVDVVTISPSIHPSQMGVAGVINSDCGMQAVGVVQCDSGVVNNNEVAVAEAVNGWSEVLDVPVCGSVDEGP